MAEQDAGFLVSDITFGGSKGMPISSMHERIVDKMPINAGTNVGPAARPTARRDARVVARFLDIADVDAEDAAAAAIVTTFLEADGSSSGSVSFANVVPGNYQTVHGHADGGHFVEAEYLQYGNTLSASLSL